jgi:putative ABC transport system ATP-binding protein
MNAATTEPVLEVADLGREYSDTNATVVALSSVTLRVMPGEFVAILGPSGCGKSTLLHLMAGLDAPTRGVVRVAGRDLYALSDQERTIFRRRHIGLIFQAYNLLPTLTAWENVALPTLLDGRGGRETERKARALLERVHLEHRMEHRPAAMSGGEQQRVAVARALMNDPAVLLADEPTGDLDTRRSREVWELLRQLVDEHREFADEHRGQETDRAVGGADGAFPSGDEVSKPDSSISRSGGEVSHAGSAMPRTAPAVVAVTHEASGAAFADRVIMLKDGAVAGSFNVRALVGEEASAGTKSTDQTKARTKTNTDGSAQTDLQPQPSGLDHAELAALVATRYAELAD